MIDFIDMVLEGPFRPIGRPKAGSHNPVRYFPNKCSLIDGGPEFEYQTLEEGRFLELKFCPALLLQGHNGFGSNDLRRLVARLIPIMFQKLGLPLPLSTRKRIVDGDYEVREVHIAEMLRMPNSEIPALCDYLRRYCPSHMQVMPLKKGVGVRLYPNSQDREGLIYCKRHYFLDNQPKHRKLLLAGQGKLTRPSRLFDQLVDHVSQGVRLEWRLKRPYLRRHSLDRGYDWDEEMVRREYLSQCRTLPLLDLPDALPLANLLKQAHELGPEYALLIAARAAGCDPSELASSRSTYQRHCLKILDQLGIDIRRTMLKIPGGISWQRLMDEGAVLDIPPKWAISSRMFVRP